MLALMGSLYLANHVMRCYLKFLSRSSVLLFSLLSVLMLITNERTRGHVDHSHRFSRVQRNCVRPSIYYP